MKTFKYRLKPSKSQRTQLNQTLDLCRWVFNETLATRKTTWEQEQKTLSLYDTNKRLTIWKPEHPELKNVHSQVLQNVQERVDLAFKAFFRRVKAGEKPGYPRFRGDGWYDSFTFKQSGFGLQESRVFISKIGTVKVILHRPLEGRIKTLTIRKDFAHQKSRNLVNAFGFLAFEDLRIKNMLQNHCLAKSISDAAWNQLITYITYKAESPLLFAENAGRVVVLVDPRHTSKQCSRCGELVEKDLSVRVHACPVCGLVMDRDENAANNILRLGLESLGIALEAPA